MPVITHESHHRATLVLCYRPGQNLPQALVRLRVITMGFLWSQTSTIREDYCPI